MSWLDYINKQLVATKMVKAALIAGTDGSIWAQSTSLQGTKEEVLIALKAIGDGGSSIQVGGLKFSGTKYIFLSGVSDKCIRLKKARMGLHAAKTSKAVVIAQYEDPIQPGQCAAVVEKFCDFLKKKNS